MIVLAVRKRKKLHPRCSLDVDCPPYHWCSLGGRRCRSNLGQLYGPSPVLCGTRENGVGGRKVAPDHDACRRGKRRSSALACFRRSIQEEDEEEDFACAVGYLMPCRNSGNCPTNFVCEQQSQFLLESGLIERAADHDNFFLLSCKVKGYRDGGGGQKRLNVRVCQPKRKGKEKEEDGCMDDFDCGFLRERGRWGLCRGRGGGEERKVKKKCEML